jgi:hypothetical protein
MSRRLTKVAREDGMAIAARPNRSDLFEKHLTDAGGYMFYSLLSNTGVHAGVGGAHAFYGKPGSAVADYDFKGLHHVRAYWVSRDIRLYLDLGDLVAPVLSWQEWAGLAEQTRTELRPLAEEAEQRHLGPVMQAMAKAPTWPTALRSTLSRLGRRT